MNAEFIYDHFKLLITEKVTMEKPDRVNYNLDILTLNQQNTLFEYQLNKYEKHVASRRSFHYELSEAEDGDKKILGKDFSVYNDCELHPGCYCVMNGNDETKCKRYNPVAHPITIPITQSVKEVTNVDEKTKIDLVELEKKFDEALTNESVAEYLKDHPEIGNTPQLVKEPGTTAEQWLINEGYPLTISISRSALADIINRYIHSPSPTMKELVRDIFGDEAANDDDIVNFYERVMQTAIDEQSND